MFTVEGIGVLGAPVVLSTDTWKLSQNYGGYRKTWAPHWWVHSLSPSQRTSCRQIMKDWEPSTIMVFLQNIRMLEQFAFRNPLEIHATNDQDLYPQPCTDNTHTSVLVHEMMVIDPGEKPSRMITWKTTVFLSHIMRRSHDDRFPIPLWETWFCSSLVVPIPVLVNPVIVNERRHRNQGLCCSVSWTRQRSSSMTRWFWMSRWHMTDTDDYRHTPLENSRIHSPSMTLLRQACRP